MRDKRIKDKHIRRSDKLLIKFNNIVFNILNFLTGKPDDTPKVKGLRYFTYVMIILITNILLGKNIGNRNYPWYANVSIFLLMNINIILVLILFIVLFRNIAKLMADRRNRLFGSRLQTKLVLFSVLLVVLPVLTMYMMTTKLVNNSIDRWFDNNVLRTIKVANDLSASYQSIETSKLTAQTKSIADSFINKNIGRVVEQERLQGTTQDYIDKGFLNVISVYTLSGTSYTQQNIGGFYLDFITDELLKDIFIGNTISKSNFSSDKPYFWVGTPIYNSTGEVVGAVVAVEFTSLALIKGTEEISDLNSLFRQLRFYSHPVRKAFKVSLFLAALLVVFASIWGSMIFVRAIAKPLKELAVAAGRISRGRLDTVVEVYGNDEITYLSKAFNYMASSLKEQTAELRDRNKELNVALSRISRDKMYIDTIYKNVESAIILFDKSLKILKANDSAKFLVRHSGQSIMDTALEQISDFIDSVEKEQMIQTSARIGDEDKFFTVHVNKIFDTNGELENIILVIDDNTHLLNLQRITLWKEIATRITHEIKNPLTPIKLTAERVKKRSREIQEPVIKELVEKSMVLIVNETEELLRMVEEFNQFARMPSPVRVSTNLIELLEEIVEFHNRSNDIKVEFYYNKDNDYTVDGDKYQLKRVFVNLIQNSMQAIDDNGTITINAQLTEDGVFISLEDDGKGIELEDLKNIFIPYFSKKPDGTGLGLAIVHKIVQEHGGKITVESEVGKFTRFNIKFPYV